jgi:hypothetical protein
MHTGGVVGKTGKIFAEAGEVIVPKKLANGGMAEINKTGAMASVKVDFGDIVSKLESIELKVEDKTLVVEDKVLEVNVPDSIPVDAPDSISVDSTNLPTVSVEQPSWTVSVDTDVKIPVEQPSWSIPVEVPTDAITVTVDATTAASDLSQAINSAAQQIASTLSNIDVSVASTNAVGSEALNEMATQMQRFKDELIFVKNDYNNQIRMISDKQTDSPTHDIDRMINVAIVNSVGDIKQDLNNIRTDLSRVESTQRRNEITLDARLSSLQYDLDIARNTVGTNGIGRYTT